MSVPLVYHPSYSFPFPGRHRFPMEKFRLLHERLRDGGVAGAANLHRPGRARPALLSLAHCPEYLDRFLEIASDRHGSFDGYLEQAIGVDEALREALITRFVA